MFESAIFLDTQVGGSNQMKKVKCDLCDYVADGASFEEWMKNLMPHYINAHPDVMSDTSKGASDRDRWMSENRRRFEQAPNDTD